MLQWTREGGGGGWVGYDRFQVLADSRRGVWPTQVKEVPTLLITVIWLNCSEAALLSSKYTEEVHENSGGSPDEQMNNSIKRGGQREGWGQGQEGSCASLLFWLKNVQDSELSCSSAGPQSLI